MSDITSVIAQVLPVTLLFGAMVMLARAQRAKPRLDRIKVPVLQPVPKRVERDPREQ